MAYLGFLDPDAIKEAQKQFVAGVVTPASVRIKSSQADGLTAHMTRLHPNLNFSASKDASGGICMVVHYALTYSKWPSSRDSPHMMNLVARGVCIHFSSVGELKNIFWGANRGADVDKTPQGSVKNIIAAYQGTPVKKWLAGPKTDGMNIKVYKLNPDGKFHFQTSSRTLSEAELCPAMHTFRSQMEAKASLILDEICSRGMVIECEVHTRDIVDVKGAHSSGESDREALSLIGVVDRTGMFNIEVGDRLVREMGLDTPRCHGDVLLWSIKWHDLDPLEDDALLLRDLHAKFPRESGVQVPEGLVFMPVFGCGHGLISAKLKTPKWKSLALVEDTGIRLDLLSMVASKEVRNVRPDLLAAVMPKSRALYWCQFLMMLMSSVPDHLYALSVSLVLAAVCLALPFQGDISGYVWGARLFMIGLIGAMAIFTEGLDHPGRTVQLLSSYLPHNMRNATLPRSPNASWVLKKNMEVIIQAADETRQTLHLVDFDGTLAANDTWHQELLAKAGAFRMCGSYIDPRAASVVLSLLFKGDTVVLNTARSYDMRTELEDGLSRLFGVRIPVLVGSSRDVMENFHSKILHVRFAHSALIKRWGKNHARGLVAWDDSVAFLMKCRAYLPREELALMQASCVEYRYPGALLRELRTRQSGSACDFHILVSQNAHSPKVYSPDGALVPRTQVVERKNKLKSSSKTDEGPSGEYACVWKFIQRVAVDMSKDGGNGFGIMFDEYVSRAYGMQRKQETTGKRVSAMSHAMKGVDPEEFKIMGLDDMCAKYGPVDSALVMEIFSHIHDKRRVAVVLCGLPGVGKSSVATILGGYLEARGRAVLRVSNDDKILDRNGERRHGVRIYIVAGETATPSKFWQDNPTGAVVFDATTPPSTNQLHGCDFIIFVDIVVEDISALYAVYKTRRARDFGNFSEIVTQNAKNNQKMAHFKPDVHLKRTAQGLRTACHRENPALIGALTAAHGAHPPFSATPVLHAITASRMMLVPVPETSGVHQDHERHVTLNLASPTEMPTKRELLAFLGAPEVPVSFTGEIVTISAEGGENKDYGVFHMVRIGAGVPCYSYKTKEVLHVTESGAECFGFMIWLLWARYNPDDGVSFLEFIDGQVFRNLKSPRDRSGRSYDVRASVRFDGNKKVESFETQLRGHFVYANKIVYDQPVTSSDVTAEVMWSGQALV